MFGEETVWLSQKQMADLFNVDVATINYHIKQVFETWELMPDLTIRKFLIVQKEGKREVSRNTVFYNLDAIISVGYRVNSQQATQFRIWATKTLKEYIIKGFVLDDERLKNGTHFGKDYFEDLLARVREIRASERRFYQKITDIYATSADYDKNAEITKEFFAEVQNKVLFAITNQTAPELIHARVDSKKPHMGLTSWKSEKDGGKIVKTDIHISKNYLEAEELEKLNLLITQLLDFAVFQIKNRKVMYMTDWVKKVDDFLTLNDVPILKNKWKISKNRATNKANREFEKFRKMQDQEYLSDYDKFIQLTSKIKK